MKQASCRHQSQHVLGDNKRHRPPRRLASKAIRRALDMPVSRPPLWLAFASNAVSTAWIFFASALRYCSLRCAAGFGFRALHSRHLVRADQLLVPQRRQHHSAIVLELSRFSKISSSGARAPLSPPPTWTDFIFCYKKIIPAIDPNSCFL